MNRPNLTMTSTHLRPLGGKPRADLMSIAGGALMFAGASAVVFALLAALSTAAEARTAPPSTQSSGPVTYTAK